ncbi:MAG: SMP-30/gluconolactonase/LRE family protein [Saprospiraceae bacterium]|nr:SMP-30/gluconolactonase/LRE family protein [Saprospiraceae bacterium]
MNRIKLFICLLALALSFKGFAQESNKEMGSIEFISEELNKLIKKDAKVEVIAEGCQFTEGPLWLKKEKMLLFSDVPANTVYKWTEAKGKEVYLKPGGYTSSEPRGGFMGPDALYKTKDGKLWICQHGDRRIASMDAPINAPKPNFTTVVGEYNGKRLNSPNDLFMSSTGDLYFTDPAYGLEGGMRDPKKELAFQGVYKMDKAGKVTLLIDSLQFPNGIGILPDGKTLLVAETQGRKRGWYAYDIASNGSLQNGRVFYTPGDIREPGGCDGLKIDKKRQRSCNGSGRRLDIYEGRKIDWQNKSERCNSRQLRVDTRW